MCGLFVCFNRRGHSDKTELILQQEQIHVRVFAHVQGHCRKSCSDHPIPQPQDGRVLVTQVRDRGAQV
jgi:hypothetical protein